MSELPPNLFSEKASPKRSISPPRKCLRGGRYKSLRFGVISFSTGQGSARGGMKPVNFIKPEFKGKQIQVDRANRTEIVRLVMQSFKDDLILDSHLVKRIRAFCRRNKLSKAEIHAVLFKLGWRYRITHGYNRNLRHVCINGYWDDKP